MQILAKVRPAFNRMMGVRYPNGWHSFDRTPWNHPWLTEKNLSAFREFSKQIRAEAASVASKFDDSGFRIAFVGNLANSSYQRIRALQQIGVDATLFLHPSDNYPMSQPEWEDYDGIIPEGVVDLEQIRATGISSPSVTNAYKIPPTTVDPEKLPGFVRADDFNRWPAYFSYLPLLDKLQQFDSLYTVQAPYLAYLSGRPYVATHMGGDIWYECSRGDALGELQRQAFDRADAITVSNPWSPAFARRYGMRNMIVLPMILDTAQYCPGPPIWREEWRAKTGGNFFVLSTARLDDRYKGSNLAIEGFARLAAERPGARLVLLGWGNDLEKHKEKLRALGIADRVLFLPPSGKKRLIQYLRSADCLLDQFVLGYFGLTALEAMSVGLPVIMRLETAQYDAFLDTGAPPVLSAESVAGVAGTLVRLADNPEYRNDIAEKELAWFARSASPQAWGGTYRDLLVAAAVGHKFNFSNSPLAEPLGRDELEYHRHELENAPLFPNYH
jgi:glycosyltransferase involved in cell wall biosynthesis